MLPSKLHHSPVPLCPQASLALATLPQHHSPFSSQSFLLPNFSTCSRFWPPQKVFLIVVANSYADWSSSLLHTLLILPILRESLSSGPEFRAICPPDVLVPVWQLATVRCLPLDLQCVNLGVKVAEWGLQIDSGTQGQIIIDYLC